LKVNLRLLSVFVLVAQHRSFRKAAEELDRSQSAVSNQIRQLEEQLGVTLFHRTTRQVVLSSDGQQLYAFVCDALANIDRGVNAILDAAEISRGRVVFACATLAGGRLAEILSACRREFPDVIVHVHELAAADLLEAIQLQDVDFGIGPRANRDTDFHFEGILQDDIWAIVPSSHNLARRSKVSVAELRRLPMLIVTQSAARVLGEDVTDSVDGRLMSKYEGTQVQTLVSLVEAGLCAAILPKLATPPAEKRRFKTLALDPPATQEICIITLPGRVLAPMAKRFVEIAVRVLRESTLDS
jgi:DNA-binding transcriptional LysR family regulator